MVRLCPLGRGPLGLVEPGETSPLDVSRIGSSSSGPANALRKLTPNPDVPRRSGRAAKLLALGTEPNEPEPERRRAATAMGDDGEYEL
jgi:hypothetical protein